MGRKELLRGDIINRSLDRIENVRRRWRENSTRRNEYFNGKAWKLKNRETTGIGSDRQDV